MWTRRMFFFFPGVYERPVVFIQNLKVRYIFLEVYCSKVAVITTANRPIGVKCDQFHSEA